MAARKKAPPRKKTSKRAKLAQVYQLRVTLMDISPPIWRQVLVPAAFTLEEVHIAINESMGWLDSHLHMFVIGEQTFGDPELDDGELGYADERKVQLGDVLSEGESMRYEYDFGDDWNHLVRVEKVLPLDSRLCYPLCIGGARACPPEDCGGAPGYEQLVEGLKIPKHPEHDDLMRWVGGHFDPEGFDVNRTNRGLRELEAVTDE